MELIPKNEAPRLGIKAGISGDAHAGPFRGHIKGYVSWFPDRPGVIHLAIGAGAGATLGVGLPDWLITSGDLEGTGMLEYVYNLKYEIKTRTWTSDDNINILLKGEAAARISAVVGVGEAGLGAVALIVLNKQLLKLDVFSDASGGGHLPINLGQILIKLGITLKGVAFLQLFYRWTFKTYRQ